MTEPNWQEIAATLATALERVEHEPFRLKNWHFAFDALQKYKQAARSVIKVDNSPDIY